MITYYPGWRVYRLPLDSDLVLEELPITRQEGTAHITINAPAGHYRYLVRFEDTPIRTFGKISTVVGAVMVILLLVLPSAQRILARQRGQRNNMVLHVGTAGGSQVGKNKYAEFDDPPLPDNGLSK
jgi:hypothetical protein